MRLARYENRLQVSKRTDGNHSKTWVWSDTVLRGGGVWTWKRLWRRSRVRFKGRRGAGLAPNYISWAGLGPASKRRRGVHLLHKCESRHWTFFEAMSVPQMRPALKREWTRDDVKSKLLQIKIRLKSIDTTCCANGADVMRRESCFSCFNLYFNRKRSHSNVLNSFYNMTICYNMYQKKQIKGTKGWNFTLQTDATIALAPLARAVPRPRHEWAHCIFIPFLTLFCWKNRIK